MHDYSQEINVNLPPNRSAKYQIFISNPSFQKAIRYLSRHKESEKIAELLDMKHLETQLLILNVGGGLTPQAESTKMSEALVAALWQCFLFSDFTEIDTITEQLSVLEVYPPSDFMYKHERTVLLNATLAATTVLQAGETIVKLPDGRSILISSLMRNVNETSVDHEAYEALMGFIQVSIAEAYDCGIKRVFAKEFGEVSLTEMIKC